MGKLTIAIMLKAFGLSILISLVFSFIMWSTSVEEWGYWVRAVYMIVSVTVISIYVTREIILSEYKDLESFVNKKN